MLDDSFKLLLPDEQGLTKVEYAVIGALLAIGVLLAFDQLGVVGQMVFFIFNRLRS